MCCPARSMRRGWSALLVVSSAISFNYFDLFRLGSLTAREMNELWLSYRAGSTPSALVRPDGGPSSPAFISATWMSWRRSAVRQCPYGAGRALQQAVSVRGRLRSSQGIRILPADAFLRPLFKALRNNEFIGVAADRNISGAGTVTNFFGAPALLPDAHVRLALHTGAAVLPILSYRRPDNRFDAFIEPPMFLERTGDAEADIRAGMDRLIRVLEQHIARHPEQWVLFEPVWPEA